jgi:hypothetical protein
MTRTRHTVAAALAMLIAAAATQPRAYAAGPGPGAKRLQVEVQIGLCSPIDHIVRALELHPRGGPIEVWQFDDSAISLIARGLRLRLRVVTDGRSELTLKVANQDCARLDSRHIPPREGKCEYDVYGTDTAGAVGTTMAGTVSLTSKLDARRTAELLAGHIAPANALSPSQVQYLREIVGIWPLPDDIRRLGPMQVRTYRTKGSLYDVDISQLPNGERYAEISAKVAQPEANSRIRAMKAELDRAGVEMCADQSSQAANKLRSLSR